MKYGKEHTRLEFEDGTAELQHTSYQHGAVTAEIKEFEENIKPEGSGGLLSVWTDGLRLIQTGKTSRVSFEVIADPKTKSVIRVVRRHTTEAKK